MMISPDSGDRVKAFSEAVSTQSCVGITTSYPSEVTDLVIALERTDDVNEVELLTDRATVTELRGLFFTTTRLVDHIQDEKIEIRAHDSHLSSLIITEGSIKAITGFPDADPTVIETTEESFIEETIETFDDRFEAATEARFRKPGYTALLDTLQERFDESVVEDFRAALGEAKQPDRPSLEIDSVIVSILVGGYNELSFYQVSRWGEDVRLASRAKFSRKKQDLEESNLISYEKIPGEVGRPRHRLLLGEAVEREERIEGVVATATQNL